MSFKVGDRVYIKYDYPHHRLPGYGIVVDPGVYNITSPLTGNSHTYVRIKGENCRLGNKCEKGCDGFALDVVYIAKDKDVPSVSNECSCSITAIMAIGCPSSKNLECPSRG